MASGWRGAVKTSRGTEKLTRLKALFSPVQTLFLNDSAHHITSFCAYQRPMGVQNLTVSVLIIENMPLPLKEESISLQRTNLWRMLYQSALSAATPAEEA